MNYFQNVFSVTRSIIGGMWITIRYFFRPQTVVTIQYPHVHDEIPERHRGVHILETEKCIMCFQCEAACPVDCIKIEGVRGGTVEGAYQGKGAILTRFTVDYGLCLFCNLCCEPCPADCIHLGPEYDLSSFSREGVTRNLMTAKQYNHHDHAFVLDARVQIKEIEEEAERAKAAKKAAREAKKKADKEAKAKAEKADKADEPKAKAETKDAPKAEAQDEPEGTEVDPKKGMVYTIAPDDPDDLVKVSGIGKVIAEKLNENGVFCYAQIAAWTEEQVAEWDAALDLKGRIARDEWQQQVRKLLDEGKGE